MLTAFNRFSQLDRYFDQVMNDVMGRPIGASFVSPTFEPHVDVRATDAEVTFTLDVPGLKDSELDINVENGVLTIEGERKYTGDTQEKAWLGRRYGAFKSTFALPDYVDTEHVTAQLSDGVLTVRAPKLERAKPRKIAVSASTGDADAKQLGQ